MNTLHTGLLVAAAAVAAVGVAASARAQSPVPSGGMNSCFTTQQIRDTTRVNARQINVVTKDGRHFVLTTRNDCRSFAANDPLVVNASGGSGLICKPVDLSLSSGLGTGNVPCFIDSISLMTPEQVAALPKGQR